MMSTYSHTADVPVCNSRTTRRKVFYILFAVANRLPIRTISNYSIIYDFLFKIINSIFYIILGTVQNHLRPSYYLLFEELRPARRLCS